MPRAGHPIMNQAQAAAFLGVHRETLRRWQQTGFIPSRTDPQTGWVVYSRPALTAWLTEQETKAS